jgi:hypothetical protein
MIAGACALAGPALAEEVAVPVALQAELLVKVAAYDKNLKPRAGDKVKVAIVLKANEGDSERIAAQMKKALGGKDRIAGLPLEVSSVKFVDAAALAKHVKSKKITIAYFTSGFSANEIKSIATALEGANVLSAGAVAKYVPNRMVLGFDLVSGKPRLLVHLPQAKRQNVDLSSSVLKLMKVYQ